MSTGMRTAGESRSVAVLSLHKIGGPSDPVWDTWYYIPREVFMSQLKWLRNNGWTPISLSAFVRGLTDPESLPTRPVLLTFDDGYESMLTEALPCLQLFGYPSVVFVPVRYIGGTNSFDLHNEPEERMCSWDQLRRLEAGGMSVESHGDAHAAFSELSPDQQKQELEYSKAVLEQGLGKQVTAFAFPYGDGGSPDRVSAMLAAAGYRAAFLYGARDEYVTANLPGDDPYRIDRVAMGPDTDLSLVLDGIAAGTAG